MTSLFSPRSKLDPKKIWVVLFLLFQISMLDKFWNDYRKQKGRIGSQKNIECHLRGKYGGKKMLLLLDPFVNRHLCSLPDYFRYKSIHEAMFRIFKLTFSFQIPNQFQNHFFLLVLYFSSQQAESSLIFYRSAQSYFPTCLHLQLCSFSSVKWGQNKIMIFTNSHSLFSVNEIKEVLFEFFWAQGPLSGAEERWLFSPMHFATELLKKLR